MGRPAARREGRIARGPWVVLLYGSLVAVACQPAPSRPPRKRPWRPPHKPGDSILKSMMCRCKACEPRGCCDDQARQPEPIQDCAEGYDFSKCKLDVKSCASRCFEHSWRVHVDQGCEKDRPDQCCEA